MSTPSTAVPASSPDPGEGELPELAQVLEALDRIAREELELPEPLLPEARLVEDLALDSLKLTVLAVGLEDRFRVRLNEEDAQGIATVGDLAALVVRRAKEQRR